jgi:hypothetical protein
MLNQKPTDVGILEDETALRVVFLIREDIPGTRGFSIPVEQERNPVNIRQLSLQLLPTCLCRSVHKDNPLFLIHWRESGVVRRIQAGEGISSFPGGLREQWQKEGAVRVHPSTLEGVSTPDESNNYLNSGTVH